VALVEDRLDALARVYGRRSTLLRTRATETARQLFVATAADGVPDVAMWAPRYLRLVTAAQRASATAAEVYMRQQLALIGEGVASSAVIEVADLLVTAETPWLVSPVSRMRKVLAAGQELVESAEDAARLTAQAQAEAARYAGHLVQTEVRATERTAATRAYSTHWDSGEPLSWKRVPEVGACGWCRVVADRLYSAEFTGEWHADCHCDWRMVTAAESSGWTPTLGRDGWRDVINDRADPDPVRSR
jgi:hypothetical protein